MQIVIDISEEEYQTYINHTEAILDSSIPLVHQDLLRAVINGTPLPKEHGRLIDADAFERRCMFDSDIEDMQDVIYALRDYKPIIEADNAESEA